MENGTEIEITRLILGCNLKMGDRGKYIKSLNMGNGLGVELHKVAVEGKEYQLREGEFIIIPNSDHRQ